MVTSRKAYKSLNTVNFMGDRVNQLLRAINQKAIRARIYYTDSNLDELLKLINPNISQAPQTLYLGFEPHQGARFDYTLSRGEGETILGAKFKTKGGKPGYTLMCFRQDPRGHFQFRGAYSTLIYPREERFGGKLTELKAPEVHQDSNLARLLTGFVKAVDDTQLN